MAARALPLIAKALVLLFVAAPLAAVIWRAEGLGALGLADLRAIRFTLLQAVLSAALSVLLAVPVARALARRRFPGRGLLISLLGAPFILPVIVAILGLLAVFGQSGLLSAALGLIGLPPVQIYGLHGVLLAHVFFNLPLATRLILHGWLAVPSERFRLAAQLDLPPIAVFRLIEWPMLRRILPGAFAIIFVICLTSFAVALTLGGGPRAITIELAIYQAFRFDFDLSRAATLALLQLALSGAAALLALRLTVADAMGGGLDRPLRRWDSAPGQRLADIAAITLASAFLLLPLGMIVADGAGTVWQLPGSVWRALGHSFAVALAATALCLALALPLAARGGTLISTLGLALSPLVLGTGLFLIAQPVVSPYALALPVTAAVNALVSLPFAVRALQPEIAAVEARFGPLADSLGLTGFARWRRLILPRLRRPIGFAAGLTAALSMGDLGVIALFANPEFTTLPLQMYRLMSAYRLDDAAGAALLLMAASFALFWLFDRGGRADVDA
ncbi:thiamine/thiamine pyrophosphate ABC transporter permease ThiP [Poseidonocella sedimentorum]|uniref:Thiamine transport system permease protein n=1 Tax=Poseidonocella sedimentorum TaxID=871652 RepID=A0A1I6DY86_9RHOB|nr:thiamine/thiamine pyrophosphate ABC transporter permease ThiP [Poseidonocella sedimentorum]SFR10337.1 thiamine transport system permease protein [Poseidonocella sedimentorum]